MAKFTRADIRRILGDACTDEIENQLIALHLGVVDQLKDDVAHYRAEAEQLPTVQKELDELKAAKKSGDTTAKELETVKKEFDEYKAQIAAEKTLESKKNAFKTVCKDANLSERGIEKALKYTDFGKIELEADGKIKDAPSLLKSVAEEWSDYVSKPGETGAQTATPPKGEPTPAKPTLGAEVQASYRAAKYGEIKKEG